MEDHRGELLLGDGAEVGAKIRLVFPVADEEAAENPDQQRDPPDQAPKVAIHGA